MQRLLLAPLLALALFATACDLAPKEGDEEYVRAFCRAANDFSDAIVEATTAPDLEAAITAYVELLTTLEPPEDAIAFHADFIAYTQSLIDNPTPADDPPEPPSSVKRRLESQARSLPACKATNYFGT